MLVGKKTISIDNTKLEELLTLLVCCNRAIKRYRVTHKDEDVLYNYDYLSEVLYDADNIGLLVSNGDAFDIERFMCDKKSGIGRAESQLGKKALIKELEMNVNKIKDIVGY